MARASDPIRARKAAEKVVAMLRDAGHEALFAGGCVRDELLGLHPTDYDVATSATPQDVRAVFPKAHSVGEHFGVMLVRDPTNPASDCVIEIATFRTDGQYLDKRRPDRVQFSTAPEDAKRRDFTINALFLDPFATALKGGPQSSPLGGVVIDHVGGVDDMHRKLLRAVGDPELRLAEDHLRALRAVRFAARLNFVIEPATAHAIRTHAKDLHGVSRERIGEEIRRMLLHPSRAQAAALLDELHLASEVLEEDAKTIAANTSAESATNYTALERLKAPSRSREDFLIDGRVRSTDDRQSPNAPTFAHALSMWALLRHGRSLDAQPPTIDEHAGPALVQRWRKALCLSNDETSELAAALSCHHHLIRSWTSLSIAQKKRRAAKPGFLDALELLRAHHSPQPTGQPVNPLPAIEAELENLAKIGTGLWPDPLVSGDDLQRSLKMEPGPIFRRVLDGVYDAQLEGRIATKSEGMELAGRLGV
ncbi:MAG: CCA tRNA nucleotidyltransferase [Phycisphaerales bacterium]|nr:CCA tRNA nucleotidyltransferase [Phycisphaerales bacterium]